MAYNKSKLFSFCNKCHYCLNTILEKKNNKVKDIINNSNIKFIDSNKYDEKNNIYIFNENEYILLCTCFIIYESNGSINGYYFLSNYGNIFKYFNCHFNGPIFHCRIFNGGSERKYKLSFEYIELINMLQHDNGENGSLLHYTKGIYNDYIINNIINIYINYHTIEEDKKKNLKKRSDYIKRLEKKIKELKNEKIEYDKQKIIHNNEIKNLYEQENKVYQELKEITTTLSSSINILDPTNNILETQITNIIYKLDYLFTNIKNHIN